MNTFTFLIFLVGFLGGLYVLRLIFEKPNKGAPKSNIEADEKERYANGSEEKPIRDSRSHA